MGTGVGTVSFPYTISSAKTSKCEGWELMDSGPKDAGNPFLVKNRLTKDTLRTAPLGPNFT
jgi:hypothetical protein